MVGEESMQGYRAEVSRAHPGDGHQR
jgi:hypothetical protein